MSKADEDQNQVICPNQANESNRGKQKTKPKEAGKVQTTVKQSPKNTRSTGKQAGIEAHQGIHDELANKERSTRT